MMMMIPLLNIQNNDYDDCYSDEPPLNVAIKCWKMKERKDKRHNHNKERKRAVVVYAKLTIAPSR